MEAAIQKKVLVSICIPCHNASNFLSDTINALVNQSHEALEIIIIDDHSIDDSAKIIEQFAQQDSRIKFDYSTKKGAAAARNQAYNQATGEFIIFFDADDWIPTNFIATQLNSIVNNNDVAVAKWGRFYNNDITTILIDPKQIKKSLTFEEWIENYWSDNNNMTCPGRILAPRSLIERTKLWDERLTLNDDFPFFSNLFSIANMIRFNNDTTFFYRSGINGLSSKNDNLAYASLYLSIDQSIVFAQKRYPNHSKLNQVYANLFQTFIYEAYPKQRSLLLAAAKKIKLFGGSNLKIEAGGKTKLMNNIFGWKLTKIIKHILIPPVEKQTKNSHNSRP